MKIQVAHSKFILKLAVALFLSSLSSCSHQAEPNMEVLDPYPKPDPELDRPVIQDLDFEGINPPCSLVDIHPANPKSPYKDVLAACLTQSAESKFCTLQVLPYLGQETDNPSIQDIMDRVVVSDDWMATEFEKILTVLVQESRDPKFLLSMFRGVTGIIISRDLSPTSFDDRTGAYCLAPSRIWLTKSERDTLIQKVDDRSSYDQEMSFIPDRLSYVKKGRSVYSDVLRPGTEERLIESAKYELAIVTVHELSHAMDVFSTYDVKSFLGTETPYGLWKQHQVKDSASFHLAQKFPLSNRLQGLAQVFYKDQKPTNHQINYPGEAAVLEFSPQPAPLLYSATSQLEYLATLSEQFLMLYQFGVESDETWLDDQNQTLFYEHLRIAKPQMREPLQLIFSQMFPSVTIDFSLLDAAIAK